MVALGVEFRSNALDEKALRSLQTDIRLRLNLGTSSNRVLKNELLPNSWTDFRVI